MSDSAHLTRATVRRGKRWIAGDLCETLRVEIQSTAVLGAAGLRVGDRVRVNAIQPGVLLVTLVDREVAAAQRVAEQARRSAETRRRWEVRRANAARFGLSPARWRREVAALTRPSRALERGSR